MSVRGTAAALVQVLVLVYFWTRVKAAERSALCVLASPCVLPCPFDRGPEEVIHWLKLPDEQSPVHSFYHGADQLGRQHQRFRGRTSLFKEEISKGNASLQITGITLSDSGRYKCYSSTTNGNSDDYVTVTVQAPVSDVLLEQVGPSLWCRSEKVFPRPTLTWTNSTEHSTTVSESETGLFSVSSSVTLTQRPPQEYICNISTEHSWRSATYRSTVGVTWSGSKTVLPCGETETSTKTLVWTFNETKTILERTGPNLDTDLDLDPDWKDRVEPGSGSELVLKDLSSDQQGFYSCALTTDRTSFLTVTEVTVTAPSTGAEGQVGPIVGGVLGTLVLLLLVALGIYIFRKMKNKSEKNQSKSKQSSPESEELKPRTDGQHTDSSESNGTEKMTD